MSERFLQHLSVVTIVHFSVVGLLFCVTLFQGYLFWRHDKDVVKEFVVDMIPTQEGPAGRDTKAALPEPEPEPEPEPDAVPSPDLLAEFMPVKQPVKSPVKQPVKQPVKSPNKPPIKPSKEPIQRSAVKVVRDVKKGNISHYNPLSAKEIARLLDVGAKPSDHTVIPGEDQRQKLIVKNVFDQSWVPPSKADAGNAMAVVRLWFGDGGRIVDWKMEHKSNVPMLDDSVTRMLGNVRRVPGLNQSFINQYRLRGFTVDFTVQE